MADKLRKVQLSDGEVILTNLGLLVFLGVFLLGLGAQLTLWTAAYRAFFVWLVFSLISGSFRVISKYAQSHKREQELQGNLDRARKEEQRMYQERKDKRQKMNEMVGLMEDSIKDSEVIPEPSDQENENVALN
jgi:hypothetical protein